MKNTIAAFVLTLCVCGARAEDPFSPPDPSPPTASDPASSLTEAGEVPEDGSPLLVQPAPSSDPPAAAEPSIPAPGAEEAAARSIWDRIRAGFRMDEIESPLVARHEAWYLNHPDYTQRMIERSRLYLHFIVEEVEKRGMPTEIALLPMIESAYNPNAHSRARASGIWQFIPSTGRKYGLQQDWWYDGRRDVIAATRAALDYLETLHAEFRDWNLALAAYNWGENGVRRAILRNRALRKPTTYYSLRMPRETRNYLPKLQAVKNIVSNPSVLSFALPEIPDQPYFTVVNASDHIDVEVAAQLAEMTVEEFVALNPGYNRPVITSNGSRTLVLPIDKAGVFQTNLRSYDEPLVSWQTYTLKKGDTVEEVAQRFEISPARLREINGITAGRPARPGRTLLVPMVEGSEASNLADTWDNPEFQSPEDYYGTRIVHRVRKGETLSTIARKYRVTVAALKEWNHVRGTAIRAGQKLVIYRDPRIPQVSKMLQ
ncbi:MAG TPA: LysM peptidoglycan-binding domain-containing protein [Burkholderiales bacterium]|nr:LysM peptidoglycan-binding domain-containing protein [Burkholderiales bacterium]